MNVVPTTLTLARRYLFNGILLQLLTIEQKIRNVLKSDIDIDFNFTCTLILILAFNLPGILILIIFHIPIAAYSMA